MAMTLTQADRPVHVRHEKYERLIARAQEAPSATTIVVHPCDEKLGARVPIILTSRADSVRTRMASCAIASLYADALRRVVAAPAE